MAVNVLFHPEFDSGFDRETLRPTHAKTLYKFLTARYIYFDMRHGKLKAGKRLENTHYIDKLNFLIGQEIETGLDLDNYEDERFANFLGEKYGIDYYEDLSCGAEFPTPPYPVQKYAETVKSFKSEFDGISLLTPTTGAGGHMNVSFTLWQAYIQPYYMALRGFLPWIVLTTTSKFTHKRKAKFRFMERKIINDIKHLFEKYHWFHVKSYAIEFRVPDSIFHPPSSIVTAALLQAIAVSLVQDNRMPVTTWNEELQHYYYYRVISSGIREVDENYYKQMTRQVTALLDDYAYWLLRNTIDMRPREAIKWLVEYAEDVGRIEYNDELEDAEVVSISWLNY